MDPLAEPDREPSQLLVLRICSATKTGWSDDPDGSLPLAERYAEHAIEKNPNEPLARVVAAVAASWAKSQIDVALSLNPNLAMAYNVLGVIRSLGSGTDTAWAFSASITRTRIW